MDPNARGRSQPGGMHATPCHAARVEPAADSVLWCSARGVAAFRCLACKLTPLARPRMDGAVLAAKPIMVMAMGQTYTAER